MGWMVRMDMWHMWVLFLWAVFLWDFVGGLFLAGRPLEMGWSDAGYAAGDEGISAGGCGG